MIDSVPSTARDRAIDRRTVMRAAAWAVPAVAVAVAVPASAASTIDVGTFRIQGSCGVLGVLGPGFLLTAGSTTPLPVGTTILVVGSGVPNIGVFSVSGGTATTSVLSGTSRMITLTSELPAGASLAARTTLSITVAWTLNAVVTLPTGYSAGAGAKTAGSVNSTQILCSGT